METIQKPDLVVDELENTDGAEVGQETATTGRPISAPPQAIQRDPLSNRYCVPAALAALTNLHVDVVCQLISEFLGSQLIQGVFYPIIFRVLRNLDPSWQWQEVSESYRKRHHEFYYLLVFREHVGVVKGLRYYDNQFLAGEELSAAPYRRQPRQIFKVWKQEPAEQQ